MVEKSLNLGLKIKIVEYVDDSQPGWVRCIFTDAYGIEWSIIDKVPIVTDGHLDEKSSYPQAGIIRCVIKDEARTDTDIVKVETSSPAFIDAENGEHEFYVFRNQLTDYNKWPSKNNV
jgi:hypothetical protein